MNNIIKPEQIKQNLDQGIPMTLVEALPERYFAAGHLPGALNIPHDEIRARAAEQLPDKEALIVVYCASSSCQNSKMAAQILAQMGYVNVQEFVEGKQGWEEAGYPLELANTGAEV